VPQSQGGKPIEESEEDTNDGGAQENVSGKNNFSRSKTNQLFRMTEGVRAYRIHTKSA
jgi:hypothetical protein